MSDQQEVIDAVLDWVSVMEQDPFGAGEIYGCDCGCGGDSITEEDIEDFDREVERARKRLDAMFDKHGIEGGNYPLGF